MFWKNPFRLLRCVHCTTCVTIGGQWQHCVTSDNIIAGGNGAANAQCWLHFNRCRSHRLLQLQLQHLIVAAAAAAAVVVVAFLALRLLHLLSLHLSLCEVSHLQEETAVVE